MALIPGTKGKKKRQVTVKSGLNRRPCVQKFEDEDMIKLLREGMNKTEIAKVLGCTRQAIHKRIDLLGLKVIPPNKHITPEEILGESADKLTLQERNFAMDVATGSKPSVAARKNFPDLAPRTQQMKSSTLMRRPDVKEAIDTIMERAGMGRVKRVEKLVEHIRSKKEETSLKALDMSFKLTDEYPAQKTVKINVNMDWIPVDLNNYRVGVEVVEEEAQVIEGEIVDGDEEE